MNYGEIEEDQKNHVHVRVLTYISLSGLRERCEVIGRIFFSL